MGTLPMTQTIQVACCLDRLANHLNYFTVPFPEGDDKKKLFDLIRFIRHYIQATRVACTSGCDGPVIMDINNNAIWIKGFITDIKQLLLEDGFKTHRSGIQSIMLMMVNAADGMCFEGAESDIRALMGYDEIQRTQWVDYANERVLFIKAKLNEFEQHFS